VENGLTFTIFRIVCTLIVLGVALFFLLVQFRTPHWPRTKVFVILFLIALLAGIIYFCGCAVFATASRADLGYGPLFLGIWLIVLLYSLGGIAKYGPNKDFSSRELRCHLAWGCATATCFITQFTTCASIMFGHPKLLTDEAFDVVFSTTAISTLALCIITAVFSIMAKRYAPLWVAIIGAVIGLMLSGMLAPA